MEGDEDATVATHIEHQARANDQRSNATAEFRIESGANQNDAQD